MEAINATLRGNPSQNSPTQFIHLSELGISNFLYNWYEHENLRDYRAEAFATILGPGSYSYSYELRATTPGEYIVPPSKIEEMYNPETFGRTASEHIIIEP